MTLDIMYLKKNGGWTALDAVRQNLGVEADDDSMDARIARMTPKEFVKRYAAWHLGHESWGSTFYEVVGTANAAEVK